MITQDLSRRCIAKRGESVSTYPRRPKAEAFSNAVDVVERLHGLTDQALKLRHLRVLAHVQLDDVPQTPIQQSFAGEFRQHDGVMTVLMMLPTQGFA